MIVPLYLLQGAGGSVGRWRRDGTTARLFKAFTQSDTDAAPSGTILKEAATLQSRMVAQGSMVVMPLADDRQFHTLRHPRSTISPQAQAWAQRGLWRHIAAHAPH